MDFKAQRIVVAPPDVDDAVVRRDLPYKTSEGLVLQADLYLPRNASAQTPVPVVIFIHGDAPQEILADAKDWGQYRSWAVLTAASGMAAITFNHRSTERMTRVAEAMSDVVDLVGWVRENAASLHVDPERVGVWVCSAGAPAGLTPVITGEVGPVRCAAALYALLDIGPGRMPAGAPPASLRPFSPLAALADRRGPVPPLLVVRAGQDHSDFTLSAEQFIKEALTQNLDIEVMNYPTGLHAFDLRNNEGRSHHIIHRVIAFFQEHLGA